MEIVYLFNSQGDWIATRVDRNVYSIGKKRIGYLPWEEGIVFTLEGLYLGSITKNNRLYYFKFQSIPPAPPSSPGDSYPDNPGYPGRMESEDVPVGARDVYLPPIYDPKDFP